MGGEGLLDRGGKPLGGDFVTFYAAARLVGQGDAALAFDLARLHAEEQAVIGAPIDRFAWHYPPPALLAVAPLARLPFGWSLALSSLASLALYLGLLRSVDRSPITLGLALAFPGLFQNLIHGQNGCLSLALMGGGLSLVDRRPWLAGALLGGMVYKPHLAPALAVALLAGGRWRSLLAMGASAGALCGLSLLALGPGPWAAFLGNLDLARAVLYEGGVAWEKMPTASAALLLLGLPPGPTQAAQLAWSAAVALAVAAVWRRGAAPPLRASAAMIGALAASPFAFEYDLVVLALPLAWLWGLAREGARPPWLLALAWVLPVAAPGIAGLTGLQLGPLVLGALLLHVLARSRP